MLSVTISILNLIQSYNRTLRVLSLSMILALAEINIFETRLKCMYRENYFSTFKWRKMPLFSVEGLFCFVTICQACSTQVFVFPLKSQLLTGRRNFLCQNADSGIPLALLLYMDQASCPALLKPCWVWLSSCDFQCMAPFCFLIKVFLRNMNI